MVIRKIKFCLLFFPFFTLSIFLTGCFKERDACYLTKNIALKTKDIAKKEFNLDLEAEVISNTLYVYLSIKNILLSAKFLSEEALQKVGNATHAASRAGVNADSNIEFFKIVASDPSTPGASLVMTRYIKDIKKYILGLISRNDLLQRMEMNLEFNPVTMGKNTILSFFEKMRSASSKDLIQLFLPEKLQIDKVSASFFVSLMEHDLKKEKSYKVLDLKTERIDQYKSLIYAKVKETFLPKEDQVNYDFQNPSGKVQEYVFVVNTLLAPKIIETIHIVHPQMDDPTKPLYPDFPKMYKKYQNIESWTNKDSEVTSTSLINFVTNQTSNAIRMAFTKNKKLKKVFAVKSVRGSSEKKDNKTSLLFHINIVRKQSPEATQLQSDYHVTILDKSLETIAIMLRSFEFEDFDEIQVNYIPEKNRILLNKSLLSRFHKNNISIPELLQKSEHRSFNNKELLQNIT
ncbi:hypothetical protein AB834_03485 [PVC group bacterium (ex Bugula neritina AB1)]|nr:hypothetical protein AB834_03485 [PVC group bacterium (ex Bugula neritina AB1)]